MLKQNKLSKIVLFFFWQLFLIHDTLRTEKKQRQQKEKERR
jgi:hypothetical protein